MKYCRTKGQLISKAIYGLLTSPKKRSDEFVLFAFLLFTANKSNRFMGESMARQSVFRFYLTFSFILPIRPKYGILRIIRVPGLLPRLLPGLLPRLLLKVSLGIS